MPRKRKPAKNYYQASGHPHSGLRDPGKFELTFTEVLEIQNSGNWQKTYNKIWERRKRKQVKLDAIIAAEWNCPRCRNRIKDEDDFVVRTNCCKQCNKEEMRQKCRENKKGKGGRPKLHDAVNITLITNRCYYCKSARATSKLLSNPICEKCANRLQDLLDEVKNKRDSE